MSIFIQEKFSNSLGFIAKLRNLARIDMRPRKTCEDYILRWGSPPTQEYNWGGKYGVMETGFFKDAVHIDTVGLYQFCSLNTLWAANQIERFKSPKPVRQLLKPKYSSVQGISWDKIVLALQLPNDYSIRSVSDPGSYYRFVEGACKYYGSKLLLKVHPKQDADQLKKFSDIASHHKSHIARVSIQNIAKAEFVLVYNSTFAIDCFCHGIPVIQYAPGYFWQVRPVVYSKQRFLPKIPSFDIAAAHRLVEFLAWKYCIHIGLDNESWKQLLNCFAGSSELFPLLEKHSYAKFILEKGQNDKWVI